MSNIDKQASQVSRYDLVSGYMQKWPDGEFVYHSDYQALLDELEAKDQRVAELSALQGKPIAWESTTPVYVKFITDERYQRLRPGYKKWYKPYRCSQCAAAEKGEANG